MLSFKRSGIEMAVFKVALVCYTGSMTSVDVSVKRHCVSIAVALD